MIRTDSQNPNLFYVHSALERTHFYHVECQQMACIKYIITHMYV